jgi:hypothetical protein
MHAVISRQAPDFAAVLHDRDPRRATYMDVAYVERSRAFGRRRMHAFIEHERAAERDLTRRTNLFASFATEIGDLTNR